MSKHGKRYNSATALIDRDSQYSIQEAVGKVKATATSKFDESIELHLRTSADPRHADQQVRGVAPLPNGNGKIVKIAVFVQGEGVSIAQSAGADYIGDDELIKKIEGGWAEFDVSIATPDMMGKVSKLGKVLGRKGLMPNPKTGTVVALEDIDRAVNDARKGRVEFKLDKTSIIHVVVGKASFDEGQLIENISSVVDHIVRARPSGVKGDFIQSAFLTSTMGPSTPLSTAAMSEIKGNDL
ncbi:MAG: 50S ribosomal protein L1 [Dehalococcoidia bacterium]|nr:50S ribosomal protein L1 [Dehalococcoidia bacterium]MQG15854.1 50S ribosomal protein L1 [SAR202 cluster bacterium]